ncbi:MAG: zeta toxin family protein [Bacteroidia bacterium]|nr:zeta toxin family protein [Bacteroidia bacterium]
MADKTKRLRIFAGPNGSGKSTLIKSLSQNFNLNLGYYINSDDIELSLRENLYLDLSVFNISTTTEELRKFIKDFGMSVTKLDEENIEECFFHEEGKIIIRDTPINSYLAADIAEFIRRKLLESETSFSFETVLSHPSKLAFISQAREQGYRIYVYYITTENPGININRVKLRVAKSGHPVKPETIIDRYYRSLKLLFDTVKLRDRAFLFDNSETYFELVAEITDARKVQVTDLDRKLPEWFITHFYNRKKNF